MNLIDIWRGFQPAEAQQAPPLIFDYLLMIHRHLPVVLYSSSYSKDRWTIRYVSEAVEMLLGYKPEELVNKLSWLDLSLGGESFYEVIPKKSDQPRLFHQSMRLRKPDGEVRTFSDDGVFLYDAHGVLHGSMGVFVDITTQKQAEEAMAIDYRRLSNLIKRPADLYGLVGSSPVMQEVFSRLIKLAAASANLVITGESGTGKELAARAIHALSNRADKPFVAVNCGAISDNLFESEFFGHVKGAFTGASGERQGYLELAHGGTIFLDEIGEIAPSLQVKLLRAIDGYGYLPVGGNKLKNSAFRLIAATNRNLEEMVKNGTMREDFYYRIKAFHLTMPPLRERREDVPRLAHYFLKRIPGAKDLVFSLDVLERLCNYSWPGNVRELQNAVYRYVTFQELELEEHGSPPADGIFHRDAESPDPLGWDVRPSDRGALLRPSSPAPIPDVSAGGSPPDQNADPKEKLLTALELNRWNVAETARRLGLGRATLYRRMNRWGVSKTLRPVAVPSSLPDENQPN
ncbi:MAG: sigma 54-interacting transcriptional regulator [Deltaproteobacteria bacterium]|jgi:PAS domain S-box-containing protein|nr:sigma 54-interacting transcriptional regulator [Deltaproteobacteria bacterium]